jgi:outer membrane protein assembly factor BamE (lipoprotein component of BamABCDE complex)
MFTTSRLSTGGKMKKTIAIAGILCLAGCVAPQVREGKVELPPDAAQVAKSFIVAGKTTKKEVLERLGPPEKTMNGDEIPTAKAKDIWIYKDIRSSAYSGNVSLLVAGGSSSTSLSEKVLVVVYFDDRGVVKDFSATSPEEQKKKEK